MSTPPQISARLALSRVLVRHGVSIVLPAYNEEQAILTTLTDVVAALDAWNADFEVIVVNDGSVDRTGALVAAYVAHATNQGYGAALATGFAASVRSRTSSNRH